MRQTATRNGSRAERTTSEFAGAQMEKPRIEGDGMGRGIVPRTPRKFTERDVPSSARWCATSAGWHTSRHDEPYPPKTRLGCVARLQVIRSDAPPVSRRRARGNARSHVAAGHVSLSRVLGGPHATRLRSEGLRGGTCACDMRATGRVCRRGAAVARAHCRIPFRARRNGRDTPRAGGKRAVAKTWPPNRTARDERPIRNGSPVKHAVA